MADLCPSCNTATLVNGRAICQACGAAPTIKPARPKRHRWPTHDHPGACRNHDVCLDCGTALLDAKGGGIPCGPRSVRIAASQPERTCGLCGAAPAGAGGILCADCRELLEARLPSKAG
jgi:hypothetical protein